MYVISLLSFRLAFNKGNSLLVPLNFNGFHAMPLQLLPQDLFYLPFHLIKTFSPPFPSNLSLHLSIVDAALVLHVRTLAAPFTPDSSITGLSIRTRLGLGPRPPVHDELDQVFRYRGEEVSVKEKVRVESPDPSLMAVMAKLSALGHAVGGWRLRVGVVMGEDLEGDA